jgi:hypothetical protein
MKPKLLWTCLLAWLGCGSVQDAPRTTCDPSAMFDPSVPVRGRGDPRAPRLSADENTMYFAATAMGSQDALLYSAPWNWRVGSIEKPGPLTAENTATGLDPDVSSDNARLWFASFRVSNEGEHIYRAMAGSMTEFGPPALVPALNASNKMATDGQPFETADGKELWFTSTRQAPE